MEKDKIFFGEAGLTSTSANYTANLSKELYKALETKLHKMVLYTTNDCRFIKRFLWSEAELQYT